MAVLYGGRNKHLIFAVKSYSAILLIWGLFALICIYIIGKLFNYTLGGLVVILVFFGPIIIFVWKEYYSNLLFRSFYSLGLNGEGSIWYELNNLPDSYSVFQSVKIPGQFSDIDFVVVGPTGTYSIEVKSHKGLIGFDGNELTNYGKRFQEKDVLKQTKNEAVDLNNYLLGTTNEDVFVTPVLVFSSSRARVRFGFNKINNVYVLQRRYLLEFLKSGNSQTVNSKTINVIKTIC